MVVHSGADFSTHDVWMGVCGALERAGHEVVKYQLSHRMYWSGEFLLYMWRRRGKQGHPPTQADGTYLASSGIIEHALRFAVDWTVIVSGTYVHPDIYRMMRRAGQRVALLCTESPYEDEQWQLQAAGMVDAVWTNERASLPAFRAKNPNSHYWQHALDPERHHTGADPNLPIASHDVVFVGTGFIERCELLAAVDWTGIDLGLYGQWQLLGSRSRLREHLRSTDPVPNAVTAELYRRAKIGLNLHRQSVGFGREGARIDHAESMGPRCYELAACGRFFITDHRAEVDDVFGDVVPTFEDAAQMEALVRLWLGRESERTERAQLLPDLVAAHTFDRRIADMTRILEDNNGTI